MIEKQAAMQQAVVIPTEQRQTNVPVSPDVPAPSFNLPALVSPQEALLVIEENLEGMGGGKFDKIKIPSGGGISFEVRDENGETIPMKSLRGVIIHKKPFRAWYIKSFDEKTDEDTGIPDCFSDDMIHGSGCETAGIPAGQLCATCPKGQWGSNRKGGKGKDCADKIRIHTLLEDCVFPIVIDLPPTSLQNFTNYINRLTNKLNCFYGVVTNIGLEKDKNNKGTEYSKTTFAKSVNLTPQEKQAIKQYIEILRPRMERISRESIGEVDVVEVEADGTTGGESDQLY